eukprot:3326119-Amphidinium_carterae.1
MTRKCDVGGLSCLLRGALGTRRVGTQMITVQTRQLNHLTKSAKVQHCQQTLPHSAEDGFGVISCPDTYTLYGSNVRVNTNELVALGLEFGRTAVIQRARHRQKHPSNNLLHSEATSLVIRQNQRSPCAVTACESMRKLFVAGVEHVMVMCDI